MIADIFNFAKMRAVFRGGPKRFGAHPGFPCFCGDRRWLVGFRRGHRNRAIITLFRMLENCYQKEPARSRVRRGGARVPRGACFCRCGDAASGLQPPVAERFEADDRASARFAACDRRARGPCLGRKGRFCRADRSDQHPERFVRRNVAGGRGIADPSGISGDRRQPVPHDARHSVSLHRQGDGKYADIAAASVLAKTHRDEYMERLAGDFPEYGWERNKGYPTREHRLAIRRYGLTPHHRLTFNAGIDQLEPVLTPLVRNSAIPPLRG